ATRFMGRRRETVREKRLGVHGDFMAGTPRPFKKFPAACENADVFLPCNSSPPISLKGVKQQNLGSCQPGGQTGNRRATEICVRLAYRLKPRVRHGPDENGRKPGWKQLIHLNTMN